MTFYPDERFAMLIDGANFYSTVRALEIDIDYSKLLDYFKERGRLTRALYYTAIKENDDYSPLKPLLDWLDYNGYHVVSKPAKYVTGRDGNARLKGNMDTEIVLGMLEAAEHVDHIVLFSGDGDFRAAVEAVQKRGVRVTVVSSMAIKPPSLADELRRQADHFIDIDEIEPEIGKPRIDNADGSRRRKRSEEENDFGY